MIKLKVLIFEGMTEPEAEYIFARYGVPNALALSKDELKKAYRELSKAHHPDKGGKTINIQYINAAYDILSKSSGRSSSREPDQWRYTQHGYRQPDNSYKSSRQASDQQFRQSWAWAGWSGGASPMDDYSDSPQNINYVKKQAWEMSGQPTPSKKNEYTFWNWDGSYFRGVVTVYAKQDTDILFKISEMVVKWDNFHKSVAVFFFNGAEPKRLFLINVRGKKADPVEEFEHNSFNNNPGNDKDFVNYLRKGHSINL